MTLSRKIDKRDYYIRALNAGCYKHKAWVIEAFSFVEKLRGENKDYPYALHRREKGAYYFIDPDDGNETFLEGTFLQGGPFHFLEEIMVGADEVPNIHKNTITFYGNLLVNYVCLVYGFGDKVTFPEGPMTVAKLEALIEPRLADLPAGRTSREADAHSDKLYIDEFKRFNDGISHLCGFTQLCVPSATVKTMTVSPEVIKRRDELFKQYEGQLEDPVIQAHIDKELTQMERAWMKGDPGERFYIKSKSYDVVRKKVFLYYGQESGFGKVGKTVTQSLNEGWDISRLPDMANALRNGSYSRGALTALGGVDAKNNYRMFQNTVVAEPDCGATLGMRITLHADMAKHFISSYVIEKDGTLVELTEDNLSSYVEKPIVLRSVGYCKTANQNVCGVCVGSRIAQTPNAISTYASDIGSKFLLAFLAMMHGKAVKSNKVHYLNDLN